LPDAKTLSALVSKDPIARVGAGCRRGYHRDADGDTLPRLHGLREVQNRGRGHLVAADEEDVKLGRPSAGSRVLECPGLGKCLVRGHFLPIRNIPIRYQRGMQA